MKFLSITLTALVPLNSMAYQASSFTEMVTIASDAGVNLSWTTGHGCWCPAVHDEFSLQGKPVDPVDTACKDFKQCTNCVGKDVESACTNTEMFNFDWAAGSAAVCSSANDACEMMVCQCHTSLFNTLLASSANVTTGTADICVAAQGNADGCCNEGNGKWAVFDSATKRCSNGAIVDLKDCNTEFSTLATPSSSGGRCSFIISEEFKSRADIVTPYKFDVGYVNQGAGYLRDVRGFLGVEQQYKVASFHKMVKTIQPLTGCEIKLYGDVCKDKNLLDIFYLNEGEQCWPSSQSSFCYSEVQDFTEAVYYTCICPNRMVGAPDEELPEEWN